MKRRAFIALLGGAAGWPLAARAQQPATPVIGFLDPRSPEMLAERLRAFRQGLRQIGYVEGENVTIEYRWGRGQDDRLPALAAELARRQVGVIIADAVTCALAAKAATSTIPIVFMMGDDPVEFGLVASFNRPGGNVTGISFLTPALEAKRIELLSELVPKATAIAVLVNKHRPGAAEIQMSAARAAANALGVQLSLVNASSEQEIDTAFASIIESRAAAVLIASDPFFFGRREQLVTLAARHALPAVYFSRDFVIAGGLMSYGSNIAEAQRLAGIYAGEILKGAKPNDLPVVQPTKFELVINLKAAKTLGLTVPLTLQVAADEVME